MPDIAQVAPFRLSDYVGQGVQDASGMFRLSEAMQNAPLQRESLQQGVQLGREQLTQAPLQTESMNLDIQAKKQHVLMQTAATYATMWEAGKSAGLPDEQIAAQIHQKKLEDAPMLVKSGVLTQEQAQAGLSRPWDQQHYEQTKTTLMQNPEYRKAALEEAKLRDQGKPPFQRELEAAGIMKGTPEYDAAMKKRIAKETSPTTTMVFGDKGKPPAGFQWSKTNPDQLEPIPGGPSDTGKSADQVAQAIANYQLPPLSGWVMKTPWGQQVQGKVFELNKDYDARLYKGGEKVITDISGGKLGQTMKSFNVAIQHTNVFRDAAQALGNGDVKQFNRITQAWAEQTGQPAPTNFDAVKRIWGDEIVKAVVGAAGALGDREDAAKLLSRANSPAQLQGVMDYYLNLMAGQVAGVKKQYEAGSGRKDFNKFLMPQTISALKKHGYDVGDTSSPDIQNLLDKYAPVK